MKLEGTPKTKLEHGYYYYLLRKVEDDWECLGRNPQRHKPFVMFFKIG
jgi:hypothetical protein